MVSRAWLFGLILAVPLVGFAVAEGIQAHFNSELRSALREQYPDADAAAISTITVDRLCEEPDQELRDLCGMNSNLNLMSSASLGAGAVGLMLLSVIRLAGSAAQNSRTLLLSVFKPGLYFTALTLIGLVLVHAAIAMSAIYYGESVLVGRIHVGIIAAIGLGALVGVLAMTHSVFSLVRTAQTLVIGKRVARSDAPELWNRVDQIADGLGALRPEHIVVGLDPNFFVTEADVICLSRNLSGRTLYCSLPLSRILTKSEFSSIIGHELGHFKGLDTKFSESFYPIYRGTASSIASLQATGGDGSASIALLPAIAILSYFFECFSVAESRIGRERELEADRAGTSVTDPPTIATALVKVHAFSGYWERLQHAAAEALRGGKAFVNASKTYADVVANNANAEALEGVTETHTAHPTDSHPSLAVRLESLGVSLDQVSKASLEVNPREPAVNLIAKPEAMEEEISGAFQVLLARQLGIDLDSISESGESGA